MRPRLRTCTLMVLPLLASSCGSRKENEPVRPRSAAPPRPGSLFEEQAGLPCSPERAVGCSGLLPLRAPTPGERVPPQVAVLGGGEEAFRARVALLRAAKRTIDIQALIFKADESGLHVADLLKRRRAEGVNVRVIVDAMSNLDWKTQWMYFDLKRSGIEVEGYEALYLQWVAADVKPNDPLRANKRFHDKLWIVDGADPEGGAAIMGGLNIANEYFRLDPDVKLRWRDQDVALRGPLVADAQKVFDRNFAYCKELKGRLPASNPDNVWRLSRTVLDRVRGMKLPDWSRPEVAAQVSAEAKKPWAGVFHPAIGRVLQSRPRFQESYIADAYLQLIGAARRRVLLANAYFVPSGALLDALRSAARRGVKITIITNSPESNDIRAVALISRHLYLPTLEINKDPEVSRRGGGVELREWVGPEAGEGTLHAKLGLFDEGFALIGSYNLDPRSERLNSETALAVRSRPVVEELERLIGAEYLPKSRVIGLEEARKLHQPEETRKRFETLFYLPLKDWL